MNKNMFVCLKKAGCTNCGNCLTVTESMHIKNVTTVIYEGTEFFRRGYFKNGTHEGFVFYGVSRKNGPSSEMDEGAVLALINANRPQEAAAPSAGKDIDKPFIHRGSLSDEKLIEWLHMVVYKLESMRSTKKRIADLKEDVELSQTTLKKSKEFIAGAIYPKAQDSTHHQHNLDAAPHSNED
ncbi:MULTISPECIES: hypothetical protein [unclassified Serratia (in: enterobacteria)]|uniref:hypothetical protein n=1 Tax=unclassified Serratia (in: enterobacteria) TaxID=2647522 RepID=UPI0030767462